MGYSVELLIHPRREIRNTEERPDPEFLILYVLFEGLFLISYHRFLISRVRFMHFEYLTCHFFRGKIPETVFRHNQKHRPRLPYGTAIWLCHMALPYGTAIWH